jgi:ABC-type multidrug transport system ATPase subunit
LSSFYRLHATVPHTQTDFRTSYQDPLSALDAHVGKAVFQNVLQQTLSEKTRILVTHALHFLPQVDYIYVVADGRLAEQGTYPDLMSQGGEFSKFIAEFGSSKEEDEKQAEEDDNAIDVSAKADAEGEEMEKMKTAVAGDALMQTEERNTGSISGKVYKSYLKAGKGEIILPFLLLSLVLFQGSVILSSYWFVDCWTI